MFEKIQIELGSINAATGQKFKHSVITAQFYSKRFN